MSNFIRDPGKYDVVVSKATIGPNKKGEPMLTIVYSRIDDGAEIASYHMSKWSFMVEKLTSLCLAVGVPAAESMARPSMLLGKKVTILVEYQRPKKDAPPTDKKYTEITAYIPYKESQEDASEDIKF